MLFSRSVFLGIDPSGGPRAIAYAALEEDLNLLALGQGKLEEVLAFIGGQQQAVVVVGAPRRPHQGLMADEKRRAALDPAPELDSDEDCRLAEYRLRAAGIPLPCTPGNQTDCRPWMRAGFSLYRRLEGLGYAPFGPQAGEKSYLESAPLLCYAAWLERLPFRKRSLEGRLQRQLVLFERGVQLGDPMRFFEEITRHRLLQGSLPEGILYGAYELEAIGLALAGYLAVHQPDEVTLVGDEKEGQLLAPVPALKTNYAA